MCPGVQVPRSEAVHIGSTSANTGTVYSAAAEPADEVPASAFGKEDGTDMGVVVNALSCTRDIYVM